MRIPVSGSASGVGARVRLEKIIHCTSEAGMKRIILATAAVTGRRDDCVRVQRRGGKKFREFLRAQGSTNPHLYDRQRHVPRHHQQGRAGDQLRADFRGSRRRRPAGAHPHRITPRTAAASFSGCAKPPPTRPRSRRPPTARGRSHEPPRRQGLGHADHRRHAGAANNGVGAGEWEEILSLVRAGRTYANVHSTKFPGGEIRSQLDNGDDDHDDHGGHNH